MQPLRITYALALAALCWATGSALAATVQATAAPAPAANQAAKQAEAPLGKPVRKPAAKVKPLDINSANKAVLKKLPGMTDELADKVIANRPYGSKTWLESNGVLPPAVYHGLSDRIEARQPFKTAAENVAYYDKLKQQKQAKP